jgi:hypothetical protein
MERLCSKVVPGQGRKNACLRAHITQVTPACREKLRKLALRAGLVRRESFDDPLAARAVDVKHFAGQAKPLSDVPAAPSTAAARQSPPRRSRRSRGRGNMGIPFVRILPRLLPMR